MFVMWDVCDVECLGCGMFRMWDVWDVGCLGCGMFRMWDVWDVGCLGCGMFRMPDIRDVECSGYGMLGMWHVGDVGCGVWDVYRDVGCWFTKCRLNDIFVQLGSQKEICSARYFSLQCHISYKPWKWRMKHIFIGFCLVTFIRNGGA